MTLRMLLLLGLGASLCGCPSATPDDDDATADDDDATTDDDDATADDDDATADDDDATAGEPLTVTILHINDHHSHVEGDDFDFDTSNLSLSTTVGPGGGDVQEVEVQYGGMPGLKALFDAREAASSNPVLKLHAGDAITGTLYYTLFNGEADADLMNTICFDAFTLGNHEFDGGDSNLAQFLDWLNDDPASCLTPVLGANIEPGPSSALSQEPAWPSDSGTYIDPYTLLDVDGQQVAVVGIDIAQKTSESSFPDPGTEFLDEATTAQAQIDALTAMGIDKIILMTHYQYENDVALAAQLTGVDVIVGGDSHSLLGGQGFTDLGFNPVGDYPTEVTNADGEPVCIVQAWEYAHVLGELEVTWDADGVVESCSGTPLLPIVSEDFTYEWTDGTLEEDRVLSGMDQTAVRDALSAFAEVVFVTPDAAAQTALDGFSGQVETLSAAVIGQATEDLCLERFPGQGRSSLCAVDATSVYGSDISNIVAKAFMEVTPTADIAIQDGGGVRVDVPQGDVSIGDAYTVLPFSNTLWTVELTGAEVVTMLEQALSNPLDNGGSSGSYPYASGLRFHIDASAANGSRVSNLEVNPRVAGSWTSIDLTATYVIVTNSFIASGQDGYDILGTKPHVDTFTEYAQGFVDYLEDVGSISKLPSAEYSTQQYTGRDGCLHSPGHTCVGY